MGDCHASLCSARNDKLNSYAIILFAMTKTKKKNSNGFASLTEISKNSFEKAAGDLKLEKLESILKLIYSLFLYSVIGFFAKFLSKVFRI